ncbi:MAG: GNAT family N-acetyltransferase [Candidatus Methanosuratincola sp.]|jgi:GNAT superfamily N-acetyltransferase|uniref:N-acetyltransferase n=1 Tax=Candidatus Methanosuratincola petrocarbonis (ex Vanwonterghem et al. 2016) TaxID=1867261 RepID=A0A7J3UYZ9_9CREN|nr:GNAT family N-acetyltransferase [Candidatus Methanosuratincola sp.]
MYLAENSTEEVLAPEIRIVPALSRDIDSIALVLKASFPGEASYYKIKSWYCEAKRIIRCDKGWVCLVARKEREVVGVIAARCLKTEVPTVRIEWVAVLPSERGMGIGSKLIEELIGIADLSFKEPQVRITLRARGERQDFYRKLGFRCYGRGWMKMRLKH